MAGKSPKKQRAGKRTPTKKRKQKSSGSHWFRNGLLGLLGVACLCAGLYYFGSFELRAKMESLAIASTQAIRTHPASPAPLARWLDAWHDSIPSSRGFVVEGGELGRDPDSPFIAGIPQARVSLRVVRGPGQARLVDTANGRVLCRALRVDGSGDRALSGADTLQQDWLDNEVGESVVHRLTDRYPERFGEVWIYLGPIYDQTPASRQGSPAAASAHYAIVFDITEFGGLRALALRIPADTGKQALAESITSIEKIEQATGLRFLPELDFSLRHALVEHISPQIW
jgi:hypothetical protein